MSKYDPDTFHRCNACGLRISQTTECPGAATCPNNVKGGPWTRHGHDIPGVTIAGNGRPKMARCGGPKLCATCAEDAEAAR